MYAYSNKEILFEKCPVQFPICLQYPILTFISYSSDQEVGTHGVDTHYFLCCGPLPENVLETGTIFKSHWKALQNIRICESYKSINILYLKAEFNSMFNCDQ